MMTSLQSLQSLQHSYARGDDGSEDRRPLAPGDPEILIVVDAGYDRPRLGWLLSDLPVAIVCRVRFDRVYYAHAG